MFFLLLVSRAAGGFFGYSQGLYLGLGLSIGAIGITSRFIGTASRANLYGRCGLSIGATSITSRSTGTTSRPSLCGSCRLRALADHCHWQVIVTGRSLSLAEHRQDP